MSEEFSSTWLPINDIISNYSREEIASKWNNWTTDEFRILIIIGTVVYLGKYVWIVQQSKQVFYNKNKKQKRKV